MCLCQRAALKAVPRLPAMQGIFCWLVPAQALALLSYSRERFVHELLRRTRPGAVISTGNPPTSWKMQHMHMDILIKGKKTTHT